MQKKLEEAAAKAGAPPEDDDKPPADSPKAKPTGRRKLHSLPLESEEIVIRDPSMEALVASGEAEVIGADRSSHLKYRRAALIVLIVAKTTYRLRKSPEDGETTLVTAESPSAIIERSIGTPSLYANIATEKFDRAMPLFRQRSASTCSASASTAA